MIVQWSKRRCDEPAENRSANDGRRREYTSETARCLRQSGATDVLQDGRVSTKNAYRANESERAINCSECPVSVKLSCLVSVCNR